MRSVRRFNGISTLLVISSIGCSSLTSGDGPNEERDGSMDSFPDGGNDASEMTIDSPDAGGAGGKPPASASGGKASTRSDAGGGTDGGGDPANDASGAADSMPTCSPCEGGAASSDDPCECAPYLETLGVSVGTLEPAVTREVSEYVLHVPLFQRTVVLSPEVSDGARAELDGTELQGGESWTSKPLSPGHNRVNMRIESGSGSSRTYSLDLLRGSGQEAYIKASNPDADDGFGRGIALDGDTLVVGAFWEDSSATQVNGNQQSNAAPDSGAAYVYVRVAGSWQQQAYLKANNSASDALFGGAVAIDGDTVAVGAIGESSLASRSGAVYIFERRETSWTQTARLKSGSPGIGNWFSVSLALDGNTLVVGETEAPGGGAVSVFERQGNLWSGPTRLTASDRRSGARFGASIALSGDLLVVGASEDSGAATEAGSAYVFRRQSNSWVEEASLRASNSGARDFFGYSVAIGDGLIAVGATEEDTGAPNSGAAYVFEQQGNTWSERTMLKPSNTHEDSFFGASVAFTSELLMVGANGDAGSSRGISTAESSLDARYSGAVYTFSRTGPGNWEQDLYIKASNSNIDDAFGYQIAVSGEALLVSAMLESSNATGVNGDGTNNLTLHSGAVYVFR